MAGPRNGLGDKRERVHNQGRFPPDAEPRAQHGQGSDHLREDELSWRLFPDQNGDWYTVQVQQHRRLPSGLQKGIPQGDRRQVLQEASKRTYEGGDTLSTGQDIHRLRSRCAGRSTGGRHKARALQVSLDRRGYQTAVEHRKLKAINDKIKSETQNSNEAPTIYTGPPVIRVTLANVDETSMLLSRGLDFYGATYFPTETPHPASQPFAKFRNNRWADVASPGTGQRVRDLLPVFDNAGFNKLPPPTSRTIKPPRN
ncbi:uncharacterized protein LOC124301804 isoform X3 [Neodiprion virginianus]|uniref:uncharacterized protein LOC124179316 isoform X3 n=1 Tax=Neodiprion fabricii TaxID=2872261 RepID=UPI001ED905F4|nr:uncharacterized protein LOC124179316 isoform X3 [Neodiprion fabricii]XP_046613194.1 uncharacterized protein LOC124301804 isoform X3 [Neodiprion virginianus]